MGNPKFLLMSDILNLINPLLDKSMETLIKYDSPGTRGVYKIETYKRILKTPISNIMGMGRNAKNIEINNNFVSRRQWSMYRIHRSSKQ